MTEIPFKTRFLICKLLHRSGFYSFKQPTINSLLYLFKTHSSGDFVDVQIKVIEGIVDCNKKFGSRIAPYLQRRCFDHIPFGLKLWIHQILHEFYFLYNLRAFEIIFPEFLPTRDYEEDSDEFEIDLRDNTINNIRQKKSRSRNTKEDMLKQTDNFDIDMILNDEKQQARVKAFYLTIREAIGINTNCEKEPMSQFRFEEKSQKKTSSPQKESKYQPTFEQSSAEQRMNIDNILEENDKEKDKVKDKDKDKDKDKEKKPEVNSQYPFDNFEYLQYESQSFLDCPVKLPPSSAYDLQLPLSANSNPFQLDFPFQPPPLEPPRFYQPEYQNCICKGSCLSNNPEPTFICKKCSTKCHYTCFKILLPTNEITTNTIDQCLLCFMDGMDPCEEVVKRIVGKYFDGNCHSSSIEIDSDQYCEIFSDKTSSNNFWPYNIRFSCTQFPKEPFTSINQLNKDCKYQWPDDSILEINDIPIIKFHALEHNHSILTRKDHPHYIAQYLIDLSIDNIDSALKLGNIVTKIIKKAKLTIKMLPTDPTSKRIRNNAYFAINLSIIRYIPLAKLYQQILSSFTIGTENKTQNNSSIRTIFNNIRQFDDEELTVSKIKLTLLDPYSKEMIKVPVRGSYCTHGQCFDLHTYLQFQYSTIIEKWLCPICKKYSRHLIIDEVIENVIKEVKTRELTVEKTTGVKKDLPHVMSYDREERIDVALGNDCFGDEWEQDVKKFNIPKINKTQGKNIEYNSMTGLFESNQFKPTTSDELSAKIRR